MISTTEKTPEERARRALSDARVALDDLVIALRAVSGGALYANELDELSDEYIREARRLVRETLATAAGPR